MVIRIPANAPEFTTPTTSDLVAQGIALPPVGFKLYFEDLTLDKANGGTRIVVLFDKCVHLCCTPGWHVITTPAPGRDYVVPPPTFDVYHQDPVYCICHGSQYDPLLLTTAFNPVNNVNYVGAQRVHGPAPRALAVIPVQLKGGAFVGGIPDLRWYEYCG
jgi:Rieske Fe-S protein